MKVWGRGLSSLARLGLLVGAIVGATLALAQESTPASAAHTKIYFSNAGFAPAAATNVVVLTPGGGPRDLYIWVKDVHDPSGASTFQLNANFDGSLFSAQSFTGYTTWLGSTGRSASCLPTAIEEDEAHLGCVTVGGVPPYGAQGGGLLGKITLLPGPTMQTSLLDFSTSYLRNTPPPPDFEAQDIPVTITSPTVIFLQCADFNYDSLVDLPNDILGVILQFQMQTGNPGWDPVYDLDDNGLIDLANDILGAILQFGLPCTQTD